MEDNSQFLEPLSIAFVNAWNKLIRTTDENTIRHVNESVFRYFVVHELNLLHPNFHIEDEWKRIDLLLRGKDEQAAIEFKFYDSRPLNQISGTQALKGGAGERNFNEFLNSLKILCNDLENMSWYKQQGANVTEKYFILVGTKRPANGAKGDFKAWYYPTNNIKCPENIELKKIIEFNHAVMDYEAFGWLCKVESISIDQIANKA